MKFLTDEDLGRLLPDEEAAFRSPVPTQIVSSDEYFPEPQTREQKLVEARLVGMADAIARKQGVSRRRFFQTASGMAASFVAMNAVCGEFLTPIPPKRRLRIWPMTGPASFPASSLWTPILTSCATIPG